GTVTLSGTNTYTGGTTIVAGTLTLGADGVLPNSGVVNVNGGTLDVNTRADTVGAMILTSGSITGTISGPNGVLFSSSFAVESGSISAELRENVTSTNLIKSTSGTVTLSGANFYTG